MTGRGRIYSSVALGNIFEGATTLHNVYFPLDVVKVMVEKVRVVDTHVALPNNEVTAVVETFMTIIAWPRHLV